MEEQDPQDTAVLQDDMPEAKPEQKTLSISSVYEGLVELAKTHGKLYRTNGKRADMLKFDLITGSVFVGNLYIIHRGMVVTPRLETAGVKMDLSFRPWLTDDERKIDPRELFRNHYLSRPNGSEKYILSNFPAKDIDEMTDDEISTGENRNEARIKLEAWILCATLDGTLEKFVKSQPDWHDGDWWWGDMHGRTKEPQLVIKTAWWQDPLHRTLTIGNIEAGRRRVKDDTTGKEVLSINVSEELPFCRTVQMAPQLLELARSLSQEAFRLQAHTGRYEMDPVINEVNQIISYIETGKMRGIDAM